MKEKVGAEVERMLRAELEQLGLLGFLEDPGVTDIMVNPDGGLYVHDAEGRRGPLAELDGRVLGSLLQTVAAANGVVLNREVPRLEGTLPMARARVAATIPPLSEGPQLVLRIPARQMLELEDLVENETLPRAAAELLEERLKARANCLIAGGMGSGKTTFLNALLQRILDEDPFHRLCILEEGSRELHLEGSNLLRLLADDASGNDVRALVRLSLRMNADRLVVGEARGAEAHDFVKACNTGTPGSLMTIHANSAEESVFRLDDCVMEAGVPSQLKRICSTVDLLVFMARYGGQPRVMEIRRLVGVDAKGEPRTELLYELDRRAASAGGGPSGRARAPRDDSAGQAEVLE
ncbi:MAG: Flp pilus assembly complex ATPase component TadA [Acidobacteria bacterium]|nr:Flp pilus assembly complex ATPase component TadA [Acidobacteriota bacterium]